MNSAQRDSYIKRCLNSPLDKLAKSHDTESQAMESDNHCNLSVSYQDCAIMALSQSNLQQMWSFASRIVGEKEGVLSVAQNKSGTQRLVYDGEGAPPCQVNVLQVGSL